ncbi:hypothetical protein Scep_027637 [Stephania cephalantha]|uniref:Uncharacterized protein n=1 Tax=Stephania cephalantha TaxID=152367 RepID=A0AAP0E8A7_9MAGN
MWKESKRFSAWPAMSMPVQEYSTPSRQARSWRSAPCSPMEPSPVAVKNVDHRSSPMTEDRSDHFHSVHKVPNGDSPYVKAKQVQLIDKDPSKAISLFWSAINSGDRVDSALKDMAVVMKQLGRTDEGIEAVKSFRHLCSSEAQGSLDNVLIDLYKRAERVDEQIELLLYKMKRLDEGAGFGGKRTRVARSHGKKLSISINQERSRLLGNLAWAYMQKNDYEAAEDCYREALYLEPDKNKQCNLAVCLMHKGSLKEAKTLLHAVRPSRRERETDDSYIKSFDRAFELLGQIESQSNLKPCNKKGEIKGVVGGVSFSSPSNMNSKPPRSPIDGNKTSDRTAPKTLFFGDFAKPYIQDQVENGDNGTWTGSYLVEQGNGEEPSRCHPLVANNWENECSRQSPVQRGTASNNRNLCDGKEDQLCRQYPFNMTSEVGSTKHHTPWEHDMSKKIICNQGFRYSPNSLTEMPASPENSTGITTPDSSNDENVKEKNTQGLPSEEELNMGSTSSVTGNFSMHMIGKSWADMVEEEEELSRNSVDFNPNVWEYGYPCQEESSDSFSTPRKWCDKWKQADSFHDENVNFNNVDLTPPCPITSTRLQPKFSSNAQPPEQDNVENVCRRLELTDLNEEKCMKSTDNDETFRNLPTRRALSFDQDQKVSGSSNLPSLLQKKALEFDDYGTMPSGSTHARVSTPMRRGNRLKVFHDITALPDSPGSRGRI